MATKVGYNGLTGDTDLTKLLFDQKPNSLLAVDGESSITSVTLGTGQILIGKDGNLPSAVSLDATGSIVVTYGPYSVTLDTVQPILTTSLPTFAGLTLSSLTPSRLMYVDEKGAAKAVTITNARGTATSFTGGVLAFDNTQDLATTATPTFISAILSSIAPSSLITLNSSRQIVGSVYSSSNGVTLTVSGTGATNISTAQDIRTSASPTFVATTLSGLTASRLLMASSTKGIASVTGFTSSNGVVGSLVGTSINIDTPQPLRTSDGAVFSGLTLTRPNPTTTFSMTANGSSSSITHTAGAGARWADQSGGGYLQVGTTVTTNNNILDDGKGVMTVGQLIDSGLTASTLVSCSASKQLQSTILANANGCNVSFTGSTLTFSMTQDLGVGSSPSFNLPYITGFTDPFGLLSTQISGRVYSIPATAEVLMAFAAPGYPYPSWIGGSLLVGPSLTKSQYDLYSPDRTFDTIQDIRTTATPSFASVITTSLTGDTLVCCDSKKALTSVALSSGNGVTASFSGGGLYIAAQQNISTTGDPSFNSLTLTGPDVAMTQPVYLGLGNKLRRMYFDSNNGVVTTMVTGYQTISTPQDIRSTASPAFVSVGATGGPCFQLSRVPVTYTTSTTMTPTELLSGMISFTPNVAGVTLTFPTGTAMDTAVAAIQPLYLNMSFIFTFWNYQTNAVGLAPSAGINFQIMQTTQAASTSRTYRMIRNAANNWYVYNMS